MISESPGIKSSILETIGTPMVEVDAPADTTVAAKVESFNPSGSAKMRPALNMIREADPDPDTVFVEATSGNTGVGLACATAALGHEFVVVMPEGRLDHNRRLMAAYGADVRVVEPPYSNAKRVAREYAAESDDRYYLAQSENPDNPAAHYRTTAEEVLQQVGDRVPDAMVAGTATGGTLCGTGRRLREEWPDLDLVAVEPAINPWLSGEGNNGDDYKGMGGKDLVGNIDMELIDRVESVAYEDAVAECRRLAREEGILVGETSGASNRAAREEARRLREAGVEDPFVLTVYWDSGERYLDVGFLTDEETDPNAGTIGESEE